MVASWARAPMREVARGPEDRLPGPRPRSRSQSSTRSSRPPAAGSAGSVYLSIYARRSAREEAGWT
eukprot:CAMPEP_0195117932 /NCGR_PEP_ID=MMETSP0448-20130528/115651_1 /TAXON_ID=66468 /ORGANISM="Heterocapsa triquestra, Strain CCMP 448" /LENGTH=65 /DNA_ID=CAMNT_0040155179 /DNA_START=152 /DNA_END=346 /DNA_ORIENTATION=-